jgi:ferredoxin--NADP+ reductase
VDLSCDTAVVIGAGNVAMDVARMLAISPTELDPTDIADHALTKLKESNIRKVIICGRRGPEHAAFTAPELRDLPKLENTDVYIDQNEIKQASLRIEKLGEVEKDLKSNLEAMRFIAEHPKKDVGRSLEVKFLSAPIQICGDGKVEGVIFAINEVKDGKVITTDKTFTIKAGLVVTEIGYNSLANIAGHVEHNLYTTGWAKRGPIGVIGTNKSDSTDVVELIIKNLKEPKQSEGITALLKSGHEVIDQTSWEKINASEVVSGELVGKPRIKEVDWKRLISLGTS